MFYIHLFAFQLSALWSDRFLKRIRVQINIILDFIKLLYNNLFDSSVLISKKDRLYEIENALRYLFIVLLFYMQIIKSISFSGQNVYHFKDYKGYGFFNKLISFLKGCPLLMRTWLILIYHISFNFSIMCQNTF